MKRQATYLSTAGWLGQDIFVLEKLSVTCQTSKGQLCGYSNPKGMSFCGGDGVVGQQIKICSDRAVLAGLESQVNVSRNWREGHGRLSTVSFRVTLFGGNQKEHS